jgi:hypothetical protein
MRRLLPAILLLASCGSGETYDVVIRHGTVYDGSGLGPTRADVAIRGEMIAAIGNLSRDTGKLEIDATGLAVTPGFINMLSQTQEALLVDGRAQSDIRQGVTLEIMGEGESMGPLNDRMKQENTSLQADIRYPIEWTTLDEYLRHLEKRGVSPNVASFVGAATIRRHELGYADRAPTPDELSRMKALVAEAMDDGALGVASALIYAPGFYAKTDELIELCRPAAERGGIYISHMRSEGNALLPAVDELIRISRAAGIPAEIFHLKAAGKANWPKLDEVIARVEAARAAGEKITADMYTYPAGATGLDASMPPWVQEGGLEQWRARLRDPKIRERGPPRDRHADGHVGEPLPRRRLPRERPPRRLQERGAQAVHRQDLGRRRRQPRNFPGGHDDGSRRGGRQPGRHGLLPHVGGEHPEAGRPPVGVVRLGRGGFGPRGRVHEVAAAPAGVRELRADLREVRPRREADVRGRRGAQADRASGREPAPRKARQDRARVLRRPRGLRPDEAPGPTPRSMPRGSTRPAWCTSS